MRSDQSGGTARRSGYLHGLVEKFRSGKSAQSSWTQRYFSMRDHGVSTHDSRPTPNPEINLPKTMLGRPPVKVWIAPPTVKITAPVNRVPLRPIKSPMRPAASEVTVGHQNGMRGSQRARKFSRAYSVRRPPAQIPLSPTRPHRVH